MAVIVEQQTICQRYALDHDEVFDGAFQRQKEILLQIVRPTRYVSSWKLHESRVLLDLLYYMWNLIGLENSSRVWLFLLESTRKLDTSLCSTDLIFPFLTSTCKTSMYVMTVWSWISYNKSLLCSCISSSFGTDLQSRTRQVWKRQTIDDESWCTYGNKKSKRNKQWMLSFFQSHLFKTSLHQHVKLLCLQFALFKKIFFSP